MLKNHLRIITVALALLTVCVCIFRYNRHFDNSISALQNGGNGSLHQCKVSSYPLTDGNKIKFYAKITNTDSKADIVGYNLYISAPSDAYDMVKYGSTLSVSCPITIADTSANHGNFDYRSYLMSRNAIGILYVDSARSMQAVSPASGIGYMMYALQQKAVFNIQKYFNGEDRALITAILTGDRSEFNDELFEKYKMAGIYHIVAVSGLHTSIFISILAYFVAMLPFKSRRKAILTKIASILISTLLFMFTGYGICVVSVILITSVTWLGIVLNREYNVITSVIASAFAILIFMPYQLLSTSFQLSFLSTLGMCVALRFVSALRETPEWCNKLIASLAISGGSTLATAPVCAYIFGAISVLGLIFNLAAVPVSTFLLVSAMAFSLLSVVLPEGVMLVLRFVPMVFARIINAIATIAQKMSFLYITVNTTQVVLAIIIAASICLIVYICTKKHLVRSLVLASLIVAVNISLLSANNLISSHRLKVTFINAVRGEATLLTAPDGKTLLFDCGSATFDSPGEDLFATYFMHNGVRKIDKLYISYFDDEHTNAVNKLASLGFVRQIVLPPEISAKSDKVALNRKKIITNADRLNIPVVHLHGNSVADEGGGLLVSFADNNFDMNDKNACAVYRISYKDVSFVLSSCLGAKGQTRLTGKTKCTVLKLPNYGSAVKATKQYILTSKPEYAVITAPARDIYAKVDDDILNTLKDNGISYARTDINQTTTFVTDGSCINQVITRKGSLQ